MLREFGCDKPITSASLSLTAMSSCCGFLYLLVLATFRAFFSSSSLISRYSNNPWPASSACAWAFESAGCVLMMKSINWGRHGVSAIRTGHWRSLHGGLIAHLTGRGLTSFVHPPSGKDGIGVGSPLRERRNSRVLECEGMTTPPVRLETYHAVEVKAV